MRLQSNGVRCDVNTSALLALCACVPARLPFCTIQHGVMRDGARTGPPSATSTAHLAPQPGRNTCKCSLREKISKRYSISSADFASLSIFISKWLAPEGKKETRKAIRNGGTKRTKTNRIRKRAKQVTSSAICEGFIRGGKGGKKKMTCEKNAPVVGFCTR